MTNSFPHSPAMSRFSSSVIGVVVLVSISIPLGLLAFVTTSLAFGTLCIRVALVYVDIGFALVNSWLFPNGRVPGSPPLPILLRHSQPSSPSRLEKKATRRRGYSNNSSNTSNAKSQQRPPQLSLSAYDISHAHKPPTKSESFASLVGTAGATRDFEGVGGWRFSDNNAHDEALWTAVNSRFQLPLPSPEIINHRHHRRSLSSQSQRFTQQNMEAFRLSPATSRNRTPSSSTDDRVSYFDLHSPALQQ